MANVNTFQQFDQFEVLTSSVAKNRYIYDFAHSGANIAGTSSEIGNQVLWNVRGNPTQVTNHNGSASTPISPTTRSIIFGDPILTNPYSGQSYYNSANASSPLTSTYPLGSDNGTEKLVPIIEDNALVQLSYGQTSLPISFRSGYIELSFKTNKQNCIVAYGAGGSSNPALTNIQSSNYLSDDKNSYLNKLTVNVVNGKLNLTYIDENGTNATSFAILGNKTVADGQWHHVVINFTRPGLIKNSVEKFDKKAIEFWIDGKLDKRTFDYSDNQIFFPEITYLAADPTTWSSIVGNEFNGSIRTFASGINFPLDIFEIQTRYKYWNYDELPAKPSLIASAVMGQAQVSVNKTRALKLFWKDVANKNGIELDNNYIVDSYCITHKNKNSITETNNLDLARKTSKNTIANVRIALTENVLIWGPGSVSPQNFKTAATGQTRLTTAQGDPNHISEYSGFTGSLLDLTFSGVDLNVNDRILLTNQINPAENGIWIFNGKSSPLARANDADSPTKITDALVYVTEGYNSETYWTLESNINSFIEPQKWIKLESKPGSTMNSQPFFTSRWSDDFGNERFINLESDISIANYDLIVFMNYPDTWEEIQESLGNENASSIRFMYDNFIKSLKNLVVYGARLYVSSEMLACDLGLVKGFEKVSQEVETSDAQSAATSPFEASEPFELYFDTHRINKYHLAREVAGLTNKSNWILADFISYQPADASTEYHAKYTQKSLGIKEGNEFLIPGLALNSFTENDKLPGHRENARGTKDLSVIEPSDIVYGTIVTKLQNTYYVGDTAVSNPHDDDVTTIILAPGDSFEGRQILGKIFLNVIEDGYTMSRAEYNKATIQVIPVGDTNETTQTRAWQYSTSRLNREPRKINVRSMTEEGQTKPTLGGGGPFIQAPSSSSNGIIRSQSDSDNINYQSDLYTSEAEEIYALQEIPVLSMTYLGLQWLAE
jgi:hypothetical protein